MTVNRTIVASATDELARLVGGHQDIAQAAVRLGERTRAGNFHVAVVGDFKRGKSTLINALLGTAVLPTGVVPLTAVATEVGYGAPGVTIWYRDGRREPVELEHLADYVTEAANPGNRLEVDRAEVQVPSDLLASGLVLVDTPGVGSIHEHNTQAAHDAYAFADAAIVVLSADAPLSQSEHETLRAFLARDARTFVVLNKADQLDPAGLDEVRQFLATAIDEPHTEVWAVSARAALAALQASQLPGPEAGDFTAFSSALRHFVADDLAAERDAASQRELRRLIDDLGGRLRLEIAASELDETVLEQRVEAFRAEADAQRDSFRGDRLLLADRTRALAAELVSCLSAQATEAGARRRPDLVAAAEGVRTAKLERRLREVIESVVRDEFARIKSADTDWLDACWTQLADDLQRRLTGRTEAVRAAAADLFRVDLAAVEVATIATEPDRFTFLFLYMPIGDDPISHLLARLIPSPIRRRRLTSRADQQLARELDKHAGRARYDLTVRLNRARHDFEVTMTDTLERYIEGVLEAARRGEALRRDGEAAIRTRRALIDEVEALATTV